MGLKTPKQYIERLRDGRVIFGDTVGRIRRQSKRVLTGCHPADVGYWPRLGHADEHAECPLLEVDRK